MPRSMLSQDDFFLKMKKKSNLQSILDNIQNYSAEELSNISGQPKWIREQLVKLRTGEHESQKLARAEMLANSMTRTVVGKNSFEVRKWNTNTAWIETKGFTIEVQNDDYFLILDPKKYQVLWEFAAQTIKNWDEFIHYTTAVGHYDKSTYTDMIHKSKEARYNGSVLPIINLDESKPQTSILGQYNVRIY